MRKKSDHWDPVIYHQCSQMQFAVAKELINQYLFIGTEHTLDVGCGDGKTSLYLAQKLPQGRVVAIDSSAQMIEFARKRYAKENLSYRIMDAQYLNFVECFDLVTSFFCLPWIQKKQIFFNQIARSLRPKGKVLFTFTFFSEEQKALLYQLIEKPQWKPYFRHHRDVFERANDLNYAYYAFCSGIELTSSIKEVIHYTFPDQQTLKQFLSLMIPHMHFLEEISIKKAFVDELYKNYQKLFTNITHTIHFKIIKMSGYKDH